MDGWQVPIAYLILKNLKSLHTGKNEGSVSWFSVDQDTGALSYSQSSSTYLVTEADIGSVISAIGNYLDGGNFEHNVSSVDTCCSPLYEPADPTTLLISTPPLIWK